MSYITFKEPGMSIHSWGLSVVLSVFSNCIFKKTMKPRKWTGCSKTEHEQSGRLY